VTVYSWHSSTDFSLRNRLVFIKKGIWHLIGNNVQQPEIVSGMDVNSQGVIF